MAQTYNFDGVNIIIPGSYVKTTVINNNTGLATTGVIALVGEADSGPDYSAIANKDLSDVLFTPDQFGAMRSLFGGGSLVEAFNACVQPLSEPGLTGGPTAIYCIKTNKGTGASAAAKATIALNDGAAAKIADITAKGFGAYGNNIKVGVTTGSADGVTGLKPLVLTTANGTVSETFEVNTSAALKFQSAVVDHTVVITATTMTITPDLGSPVSFLLSNYQTLKDLKDAIAATTSLNNLTCTIYDNSFQYVSPVGLLDVGTYVSGAPTPIKYVGVCGYQISKLASLNVEFAPTFTFPDLASDAYLGATSGTFEAPLAGGAAGISTQADVKAALAKLENVRINFVVPLFSADGPITVASSPNPSYTIDAVIADTMTHVTNMSKIKARRNRQAFLSYAPAGGTYADVKAFVANSAKLANTPYQYRASMAFQNVQVLDSNGVSTTFGPWMVATLAAASQAVAGYRPIFNKAVNCSATFDPTGFNEQYEDALLAGLLVMRLSDSGISQTFLSDQTTYLFPDNNFVYNSIQAVYGADVIALTLQQQMQTFVGQSVADVTAGVALNFMKNVLANLLRNKWISPSSDAPAGFKNASVSINVPVMNVAVEVKESTGIYFVPINLSISGVSSSAT